MTYFFACIHHFIFSTIGNIITNVGAGQGLLKVGSTLVPFINEFPTDTKLYKLMSTKPGENNWVIPVQYAPYFLTRFHKVNRKLAEYSCWNNKYISSMNI